MIHPMLPGPGDRAFERYNPHPAICGECGEELTILDDDETCRSCAAELAKQEEQ